MLRISVVEALQLYEPDRAALQIIIYYYFLLRMGTIE